MKVSELIKTLQQFKKEHGDLPVLYSCCSDFVDLEAEEITAGSIVKRGYPGTSREWRTQGHSSVPDAEQQMFCLFPGN